MACAAGYALLGGTVLAVRAHDWQAQGLEGIYSPSMSGWAVVPVWFGAGVALTVCAVLASRFPREVGISCATIACLGFLSVIVLGPLHVTTTTDNVTFDEVATLPQWAMASLWSVLALLAIVAAVLSRRAWQRRGGTRLTNAST